MSASVGAAVLDGQVYNQISLRPDFPIGPLGVGLDLNFYFDADGNLREEDWDELQDAIDKIFYLRYNTAEDPFYIRAGGLSGVTMGQGLIMDNYSNTIEYPQVRRVGLLGHKEFGKFRLQGLVANLRELSNPGLLGIRGTYNVFGPLKVGATAIFDGDQFTALRDRGVDSDGDGIPDEKDFDLDNDQLTDNHPNPAFNIDPDVAAGLNTALILKDTSEAAAVFGIDVEYPVFSNDLIGVTLYGEAAKIQDFGTGFALPGVRVTIGPVYLRAEYRSYGKKFLGNWFNRTYDIERAELLDSVTVQTKEQKLLIAVTEPLTGVFGGAALDLLDMFTFSASYSRMKSTGDAALTYESLIGDVSINPVFIPKVNKASLFYQQTNVENVFDFEKTPSTLFGYLIGYEIAPSVSLQIRFQQTYVDRNGDRDVDDEGESIKLTSIETVFTF